MSVIPMNDAAMQVHEAARRLAQPPQVDTELAHEALTPQFASSANTLAAKAAMATSAAEAKDFADGALKLVQAIITLDPQRLAGGDTPAARKASVPDHPQAPGNGRTGTGDGDHDGRVGE